MRSWPPGALGSLPSPPGRGSLAVKEVREWVASHQDSRTSSFREGRTLPDPPGSDGKKDCIMSDQLRLDIPLLLPEVADTADRCVARLTSRSEEHTSELQSLMRISYAVFCLKKQIKLNRPS